MPVICAIVRISQLAARQRFFLWLRFFRQLRRDTWIELREGLGFNQTAFAPAFFDDDFRLEILDRRRGFQEICTQQLFRGIGLLNGIHSRAKGVQRFSSADAFEKITRVPAFQDLARLPNGVSGS